MAEFGTYLTSKSASSLNKASIFEVLAEENLSKGLKNAFEYLSRIAAQTNPEKYRLFHLYFDEIYLIFDSLVQLVHLYVYKASFSEKIYGLRRVDVSGRFTAFSGLKSLFWIVSFPYLRSKLDAIYDRINRDNLDGKLLRNRDKNAYLFLKLYPIFNAVWEFAVLFHQITYTVGEGKNHNPLLTLSGVELITYSSENNGHDAGSHFTSRIARTTVLIAKWIAKSFGYGLSFAAFFLQFLDYWYTRETLSPSVTSLPIPPPPPKRLLNKLSDEKCPLCFGERKNDTVLMTSGFVFCYVCIRQYIAENGKCPLSGYVSNVSHLLKLYPPEK